MTDTSPEPLTDALIRILSDHGYGILSQEQLTALNARIAELTEALRAARVELYAHVHDPTFPLQDGRVYDALAAIDSALGGEGT